MPHDLKLWLQNLPWPLANALRRACNDKTAQGRHNAAYYFFEASLKLAACGQVGSYLSLGVSDPKLDEELKALAKASAGSWLQILNLFSAYFARRPDAALLPLSGVYKRLTEPIALPAARAFLDRNETKLGQGKTTIMELFGALVAHRNDEMGHGAQRDGAFYEAAAPLILHAALEALDHLQPFGDLKLALSRDVAVERTGETARRFMLLEGDGLHTWMDAAPADAASPAGRLWLVGGASRIPLHPLMIYEAGDMDRVGFLNKVVGRPKGDAITIKRCEYLDYYSGERLQSRDAATELAALFSQLYQTRVTTEDVEKLSMEPGAETSQLGPAPGHVTIGDFEILGELGRGGMGIVYKARQLTLGRIVALKVLPPALAGDPIAVARFRREIKALGLCDHPNVVKVLTAGQDGDRHFYAMEYVDGCDLSALYDVLSAWGKTSGNLREGHITQAITSAGKLGQARKEISDSGKGLSEEQVREKLAQQIPEMPQLKEGRAAYERLAELMSEAADGLHHLHERGIIHRDLKPGNLMLTADGRRIVLMDFGLAQLENASLSLTKSADKILGTLRYMAPEQADVQLRGELVSERSDIYSFGATLYELTTLRPIFEGQSQVHLLEQVQRKEPLTPSKANPCLPRDLETIILKATQKDRDLRYAKAGPSTEEGTIGSDLKHFANGEPISARPPSKLHYLKLFYRRNKAIANTASAALVILLALTAGFIVFLNAARAEADLERIRAVEEESRARQAQLAANRMAEQERQARERADADRRAADEAKADAQRARQRAEASAVAAKDAKSVAERTTGQLHKSFSNSAIAKHEYQRGLVHHCLSRVGGDDGQFLALLNGTPLVQATSAPFADFYGPFVLQPQGRIAATANGTALTLWDISTGRSLAHKSWFSAQVPLHSIEDSLCFSPDGSMLAAMSTEAAEFLIWDLVNDKLLRHVKDGVVLKAKSIHFTSDGKSLVFRVFNDDKIALWELNARTYQAIETNDPRHPDHGKLVVRLATGDLPAPDKGTKVQVCESQQGKLRLEYTHAGSVGRVAMDPANQWCASYDHKGQLILARVDGTLPIRELLAPDARGWMQVLKFSPGGKFLVSRHTGGGSTASVWRTSDATKAFEVPAVYQTGKHNQEALPSNEARARKPGAFVLQTLELPASFWFSADESLLYVGKPGQIEIWDTNTGTQLRDDGEGSTGWNAVAVSHDGRQFAAGGFDGRIEVRDSVTSGLLRTLRGHRQLVTALWYRNDGSSLFSISLDGTVCVWDAATGAKLHQWNANRGGCVGLAESADGKAIFTAGYDGLIKRWRMDDWALDAQIVAPIEAVFALATAPSGKFLASGECDGTIRIWDPETLSPLRSIDGHLGPVYSLSFLGHRLASGGGDGMVCEWDIATESATPTFRHRGHLNRVFSVAYMAGAIVSAGEDGTIRLWAGQHGCVRVLEGHRRPVLALDCWPQDGLLVSASADKTMKVWEARTAFGAPPSPTSFATAACCGEGRIAAIPQPDGSILVHDLWTALPVGALRHPLLKKAPDQLILSSNAEILAAWWPLEWTDEQWTDEQLKENKFGHEERIALWNCRTGESLPDLPTELVFPRIILTSNGRKLIEVGRSKGDSTCAAQVRVWDVTNGGIEKLIAVDLTMPTCASLSHDDTYLAIGSSSGQLVVLELETGRVLRKGKVQERVSAIALGRGADTLVVSFGTGELAFYDFGAGSEAFNMEPERQVDTLAISISPDGRWAASAVEGIGMGSVTRRVMSVWDLRTGNRVWERVWSDPLKSRLDSDTRRMPLVRFTADGGWLVTSASMDSIVRFPVPLALPDDNDVAALAGQIAADLKWLAGSVVTERWDAEPPQQLWRTPSGAAPGPLASSLPSWVQSDHTNLTATQHTMLTDWVQRHFARKQSAARASIDASHYRFESRFESDGRGMSYRVRRVVGADGQTTLVRVPTRDKGGFGRYIGEPEGFIDYARWWQETQAPK